MAKDKDSITDDVRALINEVALATASAAYIDNAAGQINYFRAMESLLYNYKKLEALVADEAEYINVEYKEKSTSFVAFNPSSAAYKSQDEAMDELKQQRLVSYRRTRARFDEVDRVVQLFKDRKEFNVIRMYYFGEDAEGNVREEGALKYTFEEIADELEEMGLARDEGTARRWRSNIVNDMAVCMFGKPAAVSAGTYRKAR